MASKFNPSHQHKTSVPPRQQAAQVRSNPLRITAAPVGSLYDLPPPSHYPSFAGGEDRIRRPHTVAGSRTLSAASGPFFDSFAGTRVLQAQPNQLLDWDGSDGAAFKYARVPGVRRKILAVQLYSVAGLWTPEELEKAEKMLRPFKHQARIKTKSSYGHCLPLRYESPVATGLTPTSRVPKLRLTCFDSKRDTFSAGGYLKTRPAKSNDQDWLDSDENSSACESREKDGSEKSSNNWLCADETPSLDGSEGRPSLHGEVVSTEEQRGFDHPPNTACDKTEEIHLSLSPRQLNSDEKLQSQMSQKTSAIQVK